MRISKLSKSDYLGIATVLLVYLLELLCLPREQFSDFAFYLEETKRYKLEGILSELFIHLKSPFIVGFLGGLCDLNLLVWKIGMLITILSISVFYLIFTRTEPGIIRWIGFFLVAFSPILISLFPYVNTDILFAGLFILGHIFLFEKLNDSFKGSSVLRWVFASLIFGIAQSIRSVMLYYYIFLIGFWFLYVLHLKSTSLKLFFSKMVIGLFVFVTISISIHKYYGYGWSIQPLSAGKISLYIGANSQLRGGYSDSDGQRAVGLVLRRIQTKNTIYTDSLETIAFDRLRKNVVQNVISIPIKAFNLHNPYVTSVFLDLQHRNGMEVFLKILMLLISLLTILIYLLNFFVLSHSIIKRRQEFLPLYYKVVFLAVYSYTILHVCLLEIQPRYFLHLSLIQLFLLNDTVKYLKNLKKTSAV